MASIYCPRCGYVIGEFYSLLDPDHYFTVPSERHKKFCRPIKDAPLIDKLSHELKKLPRAGT